MNKKTVSFKVEDQVATMFNIAIKSTGKTSSSIIEEFMKNFIDEHKEDIQNQLKSFWYE